MNITGDDILSLGTGKAEDTDSRLMLVGIVPDVKSTEARISYFVFLCFSPTALDEDLEPKKFHKLFHTGFIDNADMTTYLLVIPESVISLYASRIVNMSFPSADTIVLPRVLFDTAFTEILPGCYTVNNPQNVTASSTSAEFPVDNSETGIIAFKHSFQRLPLGYVLSQLADNRKSELDMKDIDAAKYYSFVIDNGVYLSLVGTRDCYPDLTTVEFRNLMLEGRLPLPDEEMITISATDFTDNGVFGQLGVSCMLGTTEDASTLAHLKSAYTSNEPYTPVKVFKKVKLPSGLLQVEQDVGEERVILPPGITNVGLSFTSSSSGRVILPKTTDTVVCSVKDISLEGTTHLLNAAVPIRTFTVNLLNDTDATVQDVPMLADVMKVQATKTFKPCTFNLTPKFNNNPNFSINCLVPYGVDAPSVHFNKFNMRCNVAKDVKGVFDNPFDFKLDGGFDELVLNFEALGKASILSSQFEYYFYNKMSLCVDNNFSIRLNPRVLRDKDGLSVVKLARSIDMKFTPNDDNAMLRFYISCGSTSSPLTAPIDTSKGEYLTPLVAVDCDNFTKVPVMYLSDELNIRCSKECDYIQIFDKVLHCLSILHILQSTEYSANDYNECDTLGWVLLAKNVNFYVDGELMRSVDVSTYSSEGFALQDLAILCNSTAKFDRDAFAEYDSRLEEAFGVSLNTAVYASSAKDPYFWRFVDTGKL